jgi:hypothetical protein
VFGEDVQTDARLVLAVAGAAAVAACTVVLARSPLLQESEDAAPDVAPDTGPDVDQREAARPS